MKNSACLVGENLHLTLSIYIFEQVLTHSSWFSYPQRLTHHNTLYIELFVFNSDVGSVLHCVDNVQAYTCLCRGMTKGELSYH